MCLLLLKDGLLLGTFWVFYPPKCPCLFQENNPGKSSKERYFCAFDWRNAAMLKQPSSIVISLSLSEFLHSSFYFLYVWRIHQNLPRSFYYSWNRSDWAETIGFCPVQRLPKFCCMCVVAVLLLLLFCYYFAASLLLFYCCFCYGSFSLWDDQASVLDDDKNRH